MVHLKVARHEIIMVLNFLRIYLVHLKGQIGTFQFQLVLPTVTPVLLYLPGGHPDNQQHLLPLHLPGVTVCP